MNQFKNEVLFTVEMNANQNQWSLGLLSWNQFMHPLVVFFFIIIITIVIVIFVVIIIWGSLCFVFLCNSPH